MLILFLIYTCFFSLLSVFSTLRPDSMKTEVLLFSLLLGTCLAYGLLDKCRYQCQNRVPCWDGWTYYSHTQSCYRVYHNKNWFEAADYCRSLNANLTSIHGHHENSFVARVAYNGDSDQKTWIGGFYFGGKYSWNDGTEMRFTNWRNNVEQKNCELPCVAIVNFKCVNRVKWVNENCYDELRTFVCKRPAFR
uniref:C-type lectin domain-containing protein n=1 Tax=Steinernema glaseri TaxID=37863 RepID=A0A1I7ZN96_9BILA